MLTSLLVYFDEKYGKTKYNSEEFNTCGRSIKTGLISCDIVSATPTTHQHLLLLCSPKCTHFCWTGFDLRLLL